VFAEYYKKNASLRVFGQLKIPDELLRAKHERDNFCLIAAPTGCPAIFSSMARQFIIQEIKR